MVFYSTVVIFTSGPKQGGKDSNKLIMLQHSIHHIQSYTYSQLRWGSGYLYTYMVVSNMTFMFHNKKGMSFFPTDFHSIIFQRGRSTTNQLWYSYGIVLHVKCVQHVVNFPCGSSWSAPWGAPMMVILKGWLTESAKTVEKTTLLRVAVDVIATGWRCCFFSGFCVMFFHI